MPSGDPASNIKVAHLSADAFAASADVDSAGVEVAGFRHALVVVALGDVEHTVTVTVEESSDNSTYTAISGAVFNITASDDDQVMVGSVDIQKLLAGQAAGVAPSAYLRCNVTTGTGAGNSDVGVSLVLIGPRDTNRAAYAPQTYEFAV